MALPASEAAPAPVLDGPIALESRGVTKRFGGLVAVDQVDLKIPQGAIQGLIGPNGAGKTTYFNIIAGIYELSGGEIIFEGSAIQSASESGKKVNFRPDQIASRGISRTFQNIRLFANMTAIEN